MWLIVCGDVCNVMAGVTLVISFTIYWLALTARWLPMEALSGSWGAAARILMTAEGVFWAIAAGCLTKVNMITNNAAGAVGQTIICFGGIFFALSGIGDGVPARIISAKYLIPYESHGHFADACPYYGISCFMVATTMGLSNVWSLPRGKIVSPFWGVACFFLGAWTIGVICLWGPLVADGLGADYESMPKGDEFNLPVYTWSWTHTFQVIGAVFLTAGSIIFFMMDFCMGTDDREFVVDDGSEVSEGGSE